MCYYLQIMVSIMEFYGSTILVRVTLTVMFFVKWTGGKIFSLAFKENS